MEHLSVVEKTLPDVGETVLVENRSEAGSLIMRMASAGMRPRGRRRDDGLWEVSRVPDFVPPRHIARKTKLAIELGILDAQGHSILSPREELILPDRASAFAAKAAIAACCHLNPKSMRIGDLWLVWGED